MTTRKATATAKATTSMAKATISANVTTKTICSWACL
jgi:hypothetical protein